MKVAVLETGERVAGESVWKSSDGVWVYVSRYGGEQVLQIPADEVIAVEEQG